MLLLVTVNIKWHKCFCSRLNISLSVVVLVLASWFFLHTVKVIVVILGKNIELYCNANVVSIKLGATVLA